MMNVFEFYYASVLRYLGIRQLSSTQQVEIERSFSELRSQFGRSTKIDYTSEASRIAYTLYFAPKHAIIWREFARKRGTSASTDVIVNSIGTGPGSEIIGLLEGVKREPGNTWNWVCLDSEHGWRGLLQAVVEEYRHQTGTKLIVSNVDRLEDLEKHRLAVGSFILSELVKQPGYRSFRTSLTNAIGPASGWFLDITKCRLEDGSERFISDLFGFGFENLKKSEVLVRDVINTELAARNVKCCHYELPFEPSLNLFLPSIK